MPEKQNQAHGAQEKGRQEKTCEKMKDSHPAFSERMGGLRWLFT